MLWSRDMYSTWMRLAVTADLQSMEVEEERSKGKGHRGPAVEEDNDSKFDFR